MTTDTKPLAERRGSGRRCAMADRPILFSAPMARALLDARKTMTRRVIKPQPRHGATVFQDGARGDWFAYTKTGPGSDCVEVDAVEPGYSIGDRLWVREAWHAARSLDGTPPRDIPRDADIEYAATARSYAEIGLKGKLRPGMFLPRWASRLTLTITDVRVQRLQDISDADARAEGVNLGEVFHDDGHSAGFPDPGLAFRALWDSINAKRGFGWTTNPWVVAVSFTVEHRNIDAEVRPLIAHRPLGVS